MLVIYNYAKNIRCFVFFCVSNSLIAHFNKCDNTHILLLRPGMFSSMFLKIERSRVKYVKDEK